MNRKAYSDLLLWKKSSRRKPLILRGARQVGKTWIVEQFGNQEFSDYLKIDLELRHDLHKIFDENLSPENILNLLEISLNSKVTIGKTLLFFDEIQACPRALMSLRYFYEKLPDLHLIAAGSLLEFALGDISFPVGRVQFLNLSPMSFYEFLGATENEQLAELLLEKPKLLPEPIHNKMISELKKYFITGGMPESVKCFAETKSLIDVYDVKSSLVESYKQDFSKYAPRADKLCMNHILESAAQQIGEQTKYSKLVTGFANPTIRNNYDLLCLSKVLKKVVKTDPSGLPLGAGLNIKKFKTILVDIGFLQTLSGYNLSKEFLHEDVLSIYRGKLAEQFVGQEIFSNDGGDLYYWAREARSSNSEVDYLLQIDNEIVPIEVKSGKGGSLRSMHFLLKQYPDLKSGIVLYSGNYKHLKEQKLIFIPIYYAGNLNKLELRS